MDVMLQSCPSLQSFRPEDDRPEPRAPRPNAERSFHAGRRWHATPASTIDPEPRLCRKHARDNKTGLSFMIRAPARKRPGFVVDGRVIAAAPPGCPGRHARSHSPPEATRKAMPGGLVRGLPVVRCRPTDPVHSADKPRPRAD
jgi:hypothetical protein